jgi:PAS domain S-box-containing protein
MASVPSPAWLLERVADAVVVVDGRWAILSANGGAERLLGKGREQLAGAELWSLFPAAPGSEAEAVVRRAARERLAGEHVFLASTKRWLRLRAEPADEALVLLFSDCTGGRGREPDEELIDARFRALAHSLGSVVWSADRQGNVVPHWEEQHGVSGRYQWQIRERGYLDAVHPEDRARVTERWRLSVESGQPYEDTYRVFRIDGTMRWVRSRGQPILGPDGKPSEWMGSLTDITQRRAAEEARTEAEARLLAAVEVTRLGLWTYDLSSGITWGSARLREIAGLPAQAPADRVGDWEQTIAPDDRPRLSAALREALDNRAQSYRCEYRYLHRGGATVWVEWQAQVIYDDAGVAQRILGAALDVTERKVREQRLSQRERELAEAQRLARLGSWDWDVVRDELTWAAETGDLLALKTVGEQVTIDLFLGRIHPDDRARVKAALEAALAGTAPYEVQLRLLRSDGRVNYAYARGYVHRVDGKPVRMTGIIQDVTEQRRVGEELRESRALLAEAQHLAHVGSWVWELASDAIRWSDEMYRIIGLVPQEPQGRDPLLSRVHPEDRQRFLDQLQQAVLEKPHRLDVSFRVVRGDGSVRNLLTRGEVQLDTAGKPARLLAVSQDLTDVLQASEQQRALEAKMLQAQKMESLGILAGGIAHDFNNLLVGILGNASFVHSEVPAGSAAAEALEELEVTARRAAELARQLLAYSGKGRFSVGPIDLSRLVGEMQRILATVVSKKAELRLLPGEGPLVVEGDATQLRQVVMNLITNASDALQDRPGTITVRTGSGRFGAAELRSSYVNGELPAGAYAWVEVADTGVGMGPETAARIFDPFFTTKQSGHGLGLAATLGIVRGHRGTVQVISEPGLGTSIRVLLPAHQAALPEDPRSEAASPALAPARATVLVADDDATVRQVARRVLERAGYRVVSAGNGREAVDLLAASPGTIDVVLLDLTMPVMGGEEAFRELRERRLPVRVVLSSGFSEQDASSRFVGSGLAGFIQKPYMVDELLSVIRRALAAGHG